MKPKAMDKSAQNTFALHPLLKQRWSPRAFSSTDIEPEKIRQMLEAARWSPSSSNEQPWRFILGFKGDETHQKIFSTLVEFNQLWANTAPLLMLAIGNTMSQKKPDQANPAYKYDVGQAVAHLTFQAMSDGLFVHQMGGFDTKKAALLLEVPFGFEVLTALAVGYIGDPEVLHPNLKKSEIAPRERRPLDELVFGKAFGETLSLVKP
ncbi:MAG: nitroreductase family protein [Bacteroidales bacterium]|nr:nitroreductase family protein [Bacteroidales bacterium]